jgi:hypothetical protein
MATFERLKSFDIRPVVNLRHGPTLSMYYQDPDGNRSEFQIDLLEVDAANEFMRSDAFAANPIGEKFDPDDLLARLKAGENVDSMLFRSDQEVVPLATLDAV